MLGFELAMSSPAASCGRFTTRDFRSSIVIRASTCFSFSCTSPTTWCWRWSTRSTPRRRRLKASRGGPGTRQTRRTPGSGCTRRCRGRTWRRGAARRKAVLIGLTSVGGSLGWFVAFTLQTAAYVNALGQIELIFSLIVSTLVFKEKLYSYRDLPKRLMEYGLVHRHELAGVLAGLFRVRSFTQDDAHIYVTSKQMEEEILLLMQLLHVLVGMQLREDMLRTLTTMQTFMR